VLREVEDGVLRRHLALQLRPIAPAPHTRPDRVVVVVEDVSELRRAEALLRSGHAMLEQQVSARTRDLVASNARLRKEVEERRNAEQALRQSEACYRQLVDTMIEGLVAYDPEGHIVYVNESFCRMIGYQRAELVGEPATQYLNGVRQCTAEALGTPHGACPCGRYEAHWTRRDGTPLAVLVSPQRLQGADGRFLGCFAVVMDITDRKQAEEALRHSEGELRLLSSQLLAAQEVERKRIASELHDSIGQTLSALKFQLESSATLLEGGDAPAAAALLGRLIPKTQSAVEEVRRISMDLRPAMLDDLGILPTLAWFFREYQGVYGQLRLATTLQVAEAEVPAALKTAIYRIVQEALGNIARHAQARSVAVALVRRGAALELTVRDDGLGFEAAALAPQPGEPLRGLGLSSMRERAEATGGSFHLDSAPGQGTRIAVAWPCSGSVCGTGTGPCA
jgi:PAS domain S-box-containing protein